MLNTYICVILVCKIKKKYSKLDTSFIVIGINIIISLGNPKEINILHNGTHHVRELEWFYKQNYYSKSPDNCKPKKIQVSIMNI